MLDKKDIRKNIIWVIVLVVVILLYIIFAVFVDQGVNQTGVFESDSYIYVKNYLVWHLVGNEYRQVIEMPSDEQDGEYVVYNGNNRFEASKAQYLNQVWYFFDDDYKQINDDDFRIAYTGFENDISVANYNEAQYEESDDNIISAVVSDVSTSQLETIKNSLVKYFVDIDNDGQTEVIYTFSDNKLDVSDYTPISYLVLVKDGEVLDQITTTGSNTVYVVQDILDLENDGTYELIVSYDVRNYPTFDNCYQIYKVHDGKINLFQNCLYEN